MPKGEHGGQKQLIITKKNFTVQQPHSSILAKFDFESNINTAQENTHLLY